ncbi:zinc-dependent metalloprotease [Flavobacterium sp. J27]|uniref:zinc-dependent metalloprotease n=1 Tax=Flavobacterium sp. J27 TaxID=2060419 RepID=UPI00102F6A93|nr:zinc-dependent metalloprotease [Flavobacterium sp. J27]
MKKTLLLVCAFLMFFNLNAQKNELWTVENAANVASLSKNVSRSSFPQEFSLYALKLENLKNILSAAPDRMVTTTSQSIITIPNSNGGFEKFAMFEASNFTEELQIQFPDIRAYVGIGLDDKNAQIRLSISPEGIQTMIFRTNKTNEFIELYSNESQVYAVFDSSRTKGKLPFTCSTEEEVLVDSILKNTSNVGSRSNNGVYKTMRLALSCTAEYANYFGATNSSQVGLVLAAFNNTMTRVNGVFEKDLALHLNIISANNIIYYNASTDPYSDASTGAGGAWNTELQNNLSASLGANLAASNAAYDIGHLFGASGGGGNAGCIGCVCRDDTFITTDKNKGSGYTSPADGIPSGDNFDIDYVAHEMGHQLGANHTFTVTFEDNSVNVEPGSGSTIMGYAGITGVTDVQAHSDDYFAYRSILQIQNNLATKTCPVTTSLTNQTPVISAGSNYTIPKGTPFVLTGTGSDPDGNTLSYTWEENDDETGIAQPANPNSPTAAELSARQNACFPSPTKTNGPNFRSFAPTAQPVRYLPSMNTLIGGQASTWEALSTVARTLNFTLTGRDNVAAGGQTQTSSMVVTVDATRGPLTVSSQNTDGIVWTPGSTETVTWVVNGTDSSAGGGSVDILYTSDNGATWNVILANTPNDGSQVITVPTVTEPNCRVMVKASGNIFFNINSKNIAIGDYTYESQNVCKDYTFNLNANITESTGGYPGYNLPISDSYTITDINYYANITHSKIGQVNILLAQPWEDISGGLSTALWYNNTACTGANLDKWFDTSGGVVNCAQTTTGGPFRPYSNGNVNAGVGQNSAGNWGVYFKDGVVDGTPGTFNTFTIQLCHAELVPVLSSDSFVTIEDLVVFPNPNNGSFNVKFSSNTRSKINIGVHDMRGRQVFSNEYNNSGLFDQNVQLNNIQSGIYIVTIQDGARKAVKKIVVN